MFSIYQESNQAPVQTGELGLFVQTDNLFVKRSPQGEGRDLLKLIDARGKNTVPTVFE